MDDNDIARLYPVAHWRELPDELVESEYAALSFLSPDGFRHFIPAYMGFTLRHLESGAAAVDSTIWSLAPVFYEDAGLQDFVVSKLALADRQPARRRGRLSRGGPRAGRRIPRRSGRRRRSATGREDHLGAA